MPTGSRETYGSDGTRLGVLPSMARFLFWLSDLMRDHTSQWPALKLASCMRPVIWSPLGGWRIFLRHNPFGLVAMVYAKTVPTFSCIDLQGFFSGH
jgi:hypothetical protein